MTKPIEFVSGLTVGTIESVSPSSFAVLLDTDAPQATALNTGTPTGFPRINGYILIPGQAGAVVGQISWLGVERSAFPKRPGLKDFGLIDLPFPLRKMKITPIGVLSPKTVGAESTIGYELKRGVTVFPSVGDSVVLPTREQIKSIIESTGDNQRVPIGGSPLSENALISIDPNKLFGRHCAVIGNTGSGKSCTVAGLIRWSLESALKASADDVESQTANARFIILDPNGEYTQAFGDLTDHVNVFRVLVEGATVADEMAQRLTIPAWMWNAQEWFAFTAAAPGAQQPLLLKALHELRFDTSAEISPELRATRLAACYRTTILSYVAKGPNQYSTFPGVEELPPNSCEDE